VATTLNVSSFPAGLAFLVPIVTLLHVEEESQFSMTMTGDNPAVLVSVTVIPVISQEPVTNSDF
jgi:hypothetical protein